MERSSQVLTNFINCNVFTEHIARLCVRTIEFIFHNIIRLLLYCFPGFLHGKTEQNKKFTSNLAHLVPFLVP